MLVLPLLIGLDAMHVLIIEDEPLIAMSIEDALRDCGCASFAFAGSLDAAVASAKRHAPDLITADVQLGPGCGIDAVAAICAVKAIPVIFITATAGDVDARRPGSIIVHKPFADSAIRGALGHAMGMVH
jgi:CheY-like chemotaxis protein